jgi:hypothetical protein
VPPRWKFAVVVWLAIYPSLTLLVWLPGRRAPTCPSRYEHLCSRWCVGAVDGLSGAADAPASPRIVVASGLMNIHGALDTGRRSPRKRLHAVGARLLGRKG